jgi:ribosomal protein S8E
MNALSDRWVFVTKRYEKAAVPSIYSSTEVSKTIQANVTHPELGVTVQLPIISVKKNPQNVSMKQSASFILLVV